MRCKMLGLAIALSTFGLGVAATTVWIAYHTPNTPARAELVTTRTEWVAVPDTVTDIEASQTKAPCKRLSPTPFYLDNNEQWQTINSFPRSPLAGNKFGNSVPVYPPQAMKDHVSGTVEVLVEVNECGQVISAKAISGPAQLRQAAVEAALKQRFILPHADHPFRVKDVLTYNFLLQ